MSETIDILSAIACGESSAMESLADTNLNTQEPSGLDIKTYMMVRVAGLIAMDAPPVSYAVSAENVTDLLEIEDIEAVFVALAPVVGSARIAAAASNILDVFFVDANDETEVIAGGADELTDVPFHRQGSERLTAEIEDEEFANEEREYETV